MPFPERMSLRRLPGKPPHVARVIANATPTQEFTAIVPYRSSWTASLEVSGVLRHRGGVDDHVCAQIAVQHLVGERDGVSQIGTGVDSRNPDHAEHRAEELCGETHFVGITRVEVGDERHRGGAVGENLGFGVRFERLPLAIDCTRVVAPTGLRGRQRPIASHRAARLPGPTLPGRTRIWHATQLKPWLWSF